jgi:hypothetical protein
MHKKRHKHSIGSNQYAKNPGKEADESLNPDLLVLTASDIAPEELEPPIFPEVDPDIEEPIQPPLEWLQEQHWYEIVQEMDGRDFPRFMVAKDGAGTVVIAYYNQIDVASEPDATGAQLLEEMQEAYKAISLDDDDEDTYQDMYDLFPVTWCPIFRGEPTYDPMPKDWAFQRNFERSESRRGRDLVEWALSKLPDASI